MALPLERFKSEYMSKMNFIVWEAAQWVQFRGYEWDELSDTVTLEFRSSSYGIGFNITSKAFTILYGEPYYPYEETYDYFKQVKYNECIPVNRKS